MSVYFKSFPLLDCVTKLKKKKKELVCIAFFKNKDDFLMNIIDINDYYIISFQFDCPFVRIINMLFAVVMMMMIIIIIIIVVVVLIIMMIIIIISIFVRKFLTLPSPEGDFRKLSSFMSWTKEKKKSSLFI